MSRYCVNKIGDHEVHKVSECSYLPEMNNRVEFNADSDSEAMKKARDIYSNADGCYYCMRAYSRK